MQKIQTENGFLSKQMSIFSAEVKAAPKNSRTADIYLSALSEKEKLNSGIHSVLTGQLDHFGVEKCKQPFPILWDEQKKFFGIE